MPNLSQNQLYGILTYDFEPEVEKMLGESVGNYDLSKPLDFIEQDPIAKYYWDNEFINKTWSRSDTGRSQQEYFDAGEMMRLYDLQRRALFNAAEARTAMAVTGQADWQKAVKDLASAKDIYGKNKLASWDPFPNMTGGLMDVFTGMQDMLSSPLGVMASALAGGVALSKLGAATPAAAGSAGGAGAGFSLSNPGTTGLSFTGSGTAGSSGWLAGSPYASNFGSGLGLSSLGAGTTLPALSEGQLLAKDTLLGKGTWADLGTGPSSSSGWFKTLAKQVNPFYDLTSAASTAGSNNMGWLDSLWGSAKDKLSDVDTWMDLGSNLLGYYQGKQASDKLQRGIQQGTAADIAMQERALALQEQMYKDSVARQLPFYSAGLATLPQYMESLKYAGEVPEYTPMTLEELQTDPGYQFRLNEGTKALERSYIAKGLSQSTGAGQHLSRYAQDLASQEYAAANQRRLEDYKTRFATDVEKYSRSRDYLAGLQNVVSMGTGGATNLANLNAGYGSSAGNILANIGATSGQGITGRSQYAAQSPTLYGAFGNTLGNLVQQNAQNALMNQILTSLGRG